MFEANLDTHLENEHNTKPNISLALPFQFSLFVKHLKTFFQYSQRVRINNLPALKSRNLNIVSLRIYNNAINMKNINII